MHIKIFVLVLEYIYIVFYTFIYHFIIIYKYAPVNLVNVERFKKKLLVIQCDFQEIKFH